MLDRVDMEVIQMTRKIVLVADGVLPIAPLPDTAFALGARLAEIRSPVGRLRENADLIRRQRVAKSASPSGSVQTAWR
jgi:hypothetical protein